MKPRERYNPHYVKTYDPNNEPWVTWQELISFAISMRERIQNGSQKKG